MGKVKSNKIKRQSITTRSQPVRMNKSKAKILSIRDQGLEKQLPVVKVRKTKGISIIPPWRLAEPSYRSKIRKFLLDVMSRTPRPKAAFRSRMIMKEFNKLMPEDIELSSKKNIQIWKFLKYRQRKFKDEEIEGDENSPDGNPDAARIPCRRSSVCCACKDDGATLRCPTCLYKYCDLTCFKAHRQMALCQKPVSNEQTGKPAVNCGFRKYSYPTKDTVSPESLQSLNHGENCEILKQFLKNKIIKDSIRHLNVATNPVEQFRKVMMNEQFVQFSDFILNVLKQQ